MIRGRETMGAGWARPAVDPLWIWIACSILLHAAVAAWLWDSRTRFPVPEQASSARVAVRLVAPPPPAPSPAAPAAPPEAPPAPIAPAPPVPPTPAPFRPEAPGESPTPVPTPAPAETAPPPTPSEMESSPPSPAENVAETAPATPSAAAASVESSSTEPIEDLLARYVAGVRARIDAEKSYPALARRRSEQGTVLARVVIEATGRLDRIEVVGDAPLLLHRATRTAVEKAAPFAVPPDGGLTIEVPVRWRMRD